MDARSARSGLYANTDVGTPKLQVMLDNNVVGKQDVVDRLGITDGGRSDLPELVVRFLHQIGEFLYDADEEIQKLAEELVETASRGQSL